MSALEKKLAAVLRRYMEASPAFRVCPIGAPGSEARIKQDEHIAAEEEARALLAEVERQPHA